nr:probable membrane-associated kinase regulator 6 [Ipomoea batatas]
MDNLVISQPTKFYPQSLPSSSPSTWIDRSATAETPTATSEVDGSVALQRFFSVNLSDFSNFDFPVSESSLTLFHADELISNGFLVPLFAQPIKSDSFNRAFDSPEKPTKQD